MFDTFYFRLVLVFLVGGGWVAFTTLVAEKYGSALGGLVGGLPSTSALSFLFSGWIVSPEVAIGATTIFPISLSISGIFLVFFTRFVPKGLAFGLLGAFASWFLASFLLLFSGIVSFEFSLLGAAVIALIVYYTLRRLRPQVLRRSRTNYSQQQNLFHLAVGGGVVVLAVLASYFGGPVIGGIFFPFPAVFASTLILVYKTQGVEASREITLPLMSSSTLTTIPFGIAVRYLYTVEGIWIGTCLSYLVAIAIGVTYWQSRKLYISRTTSGCI